MSDEAARAAIAEVNRRFVDAVARDDMAAAAAVYTDDATVLPPDAAPVSGRANIQAFWTGAKAALGVKAVTLTTKSLEIRGDCAHEVGEAGLSLPSGTAVMKYLVVWHHQREGGWRWHLDIWNANPA
jgi:uncharacterized protein (TIGR02246 family)